MTGKVLRRNFIVDRQLQGRLCLHGLLYGSLVMLAVSFGMFAPLLWDLGSPDVEAQSDEQAIVMLYLHEHYWQLAVVCVVIIVAGSLRFSHRIAGPMVRFKRNLGMLREGQLPPPLRVRRSDHLAAEVLCLNESIAGVGERIDAIRRAQVDVRRRVTALLDRLSEPPEDEVAALIAGCDELERTVRAFRHVDTADDRRPVTQSAVELAPRIGGV